MDAQHFPEIASDHGEKEQPAKQQHQVASEMVEEQLKREGIKDALKHALSKTLRFVFPRFLLPLRYAAF